MATPRKRAQPRVAARSAARRKTALALRVEGLTLEAIGARLGVSKQRAHQILAGELAEVAAERKDLAEHQLEAELAAIDFVIAGMAPKVAKGDAKAATAYLRAMERRARLLGLDAPTKTDLTSGGAPITPITPNDPRWQELQAQHLGSVRQGVNHVPAARPDGDADRVAEE